MFMLRFILLSSLYVLSTLADTGGVDDETVTMPTKPNKVQWPECVNMTEAEARALISSERPDLEIQVLKDNKPATMDHREDRVRIIISHDTGLVVSAPQTG